MRALLFALLVVAAAPSQARVYSQPELDALLAPLVAYPDALASHMLVAASYPDQVAEAARGVPPQPHWHPSVSALVPYPDVLRRMAESPYWMRDVGEAYVYQQGQVLHTLAVLRARLEPPAPIAVIPAPPPPPLVVHHYFPVFVPRPHFHQFHGHAPGPAHGYRPVPEAHRRPIVTSTPQVKPRESRRPPVIHFRPDFKNRR